jgi:hypothetical protein
MAIQPRREQRPWRIQRLAYRLRFVTAERAADAQRAFIGEAEPSALPNGSDAPAHGAPPAADPHAPQEPQQPDNWEQRARTLHGRIEAENRRHRETVEAMASRITQLEVQLRDTAPVPKQPPPRLNITEQEVADYGEDFIGLVQRVAQHRRGR